MRTLLALVLLAGCARAQIVLENFVTHRTNHDTPPDQLFSLYLGEDALQVDHGYGSNTLGSVGGNSWHITGDTTADCVSGCYTGGGIYWQMFTYPYNTFPNGWMQGYILSGTFTSTVNRMNFKMYCSNANVTRNSNGSDTMQIGTYVKPHNALNISDQGQHYYHELDYAVVPNHWIIVELDWQTQHRVGGPTTSPVYDPEFNAPSYSTPVHYYDGMTRWYLDTQANGPSGDNWATRDCYFSDIEMRQVNSQPDDIVSSTTGQWDGTKFQTTWAAPGDGANNYVFNICYSRSSMIGSSFCSTGTSGGTVTQVATTYKGVFWDSPSLALSSGLYVAVQPASGNTVQSTVCSFPCFYEIYVPPMDASISSTVGVTGKVAANGAIKIQ